MGILAWHFIHIYIHRSTILSPFDLKQALRSGVPSAAAPVPASPETASVVPASRAAAHDFYSEEAKTLVAIRYSPLVDNRRILKARAMRQEGKEEINLLF